MELETKRLLIVPLNEKHLLDFYEYAKNPQIGPMAGWEPHKNLEESKSILALLVKEGYAHAIIFKETNKMIGTIDLRPADKISFLKPHVCELGYCLNSNFWGQGIMPEAARAVIDYGFNHLKLKKIVVSHFETNMQSRTVIEKLGFELTEIKASKPQFLKYGKRSWFYELLKKDYLNYLKENYYANIKTKI